ncbi:hypothetical protein KIPB_004433 [Kipferlia bialata]|uniref:Smr domain-containing protein n=1 Tax=Kipferlia bialata TaxID=797122 RepID=A0A9K3GHG4_9EUKA|nr:hypothetical protein KIPB_004433 [Kipferlia bialata]|eukprot:g4433.t1
MNRFSTSPLPGTMERRGRGMRREGSQMWTRAEEMAQMGQLREELSELTDTNTRLTETLSIQSQDLEERALRIGELDEKLNTRRVIAQAEQENLSELLSQERNKTRKLERIKATLEEDLAASQAREAELRERLINESTVLCLATKRWRTSIDPSVVFDVAQSAQTEEEARSFLLMLSLAEGEAYEEDDILPPSVNLLEPETFTFKEDAPSEWEQTQQAKEFYQQRERERELEREREREKEYANSKSAIRQAGYGVDPFATAADGQAATARVNEMWEREREMEREREAQRQREAELVQAQERDRQRQTFHHPETVPEYGPTQRNKADRQREREREREFGIGSTSRYLSQELPSLPSSLPPNLAARIRQDNLMIDRSVIFAEALALTKAYNKCMNLVRHYEESPKASQYFERKGQVLASRARSARQTAEERWATAQDGRVSLGGLGRATQAVGRAGLSRQTRKGDRMSDALSKSGLVSVDLHGYTVAEAEPVVTAAIRSLVRTLSRDHPDGSACLEVVSGRGKHSKSKTSPLRRWLMGYLTRESLKWRWAQDSMQGAVIVTVTPKTHISGP